MLKSRSNSNTYGSVSWIDRNLILVINEIQGGFFGNSN